LIDLGIYAAASGDFKKAHQYFGESQTRFSELEGSPSKATVLLNSAVFALLNDNPDAAKQGFEQLNHGIEISKNLSDKPRWDKHFLLASFHLVFIQEDQSHASSVLTAIEEALEIFGEFRSSHFSPEQLYFLASQVYRVNKYIDKADEYLRQAYERVMLVVAHTKDEELRRSYLKNVSENWEILKAAKERGIATEELGNAGVT
jgi:hypothetical protein